MKWILALGHVGQRAVSIVVRVYAFALAHAFAMVTVKAILLKCPLVIEASATVSCVKGCLDGNFAFVFGFLTFYLWFDTHFCLLIFKIILFPETFYNLFNLVILL